MNLSLKLFASAAKGFSNLKTNIIRNEDVLLKAYVIVVHEFEASMHTKTIAPLSSISGSALGGS